MSFSARILADSLAPSGKRLTTFEATYPRCIHSELMTHRMLSRNTASSRAIPVEKMIQRVEEDPFIPLYWGRNQKGMQAEQELDGLARQSAKIAWLTACDYAVSCARSMNKIGLHKQIANRLLEPFMWITAIISATEWTNFFGLRCHKDAEPHFQHIAGMMHGVYESSWPMELRAGEWHLPLTGRDDMETGHDVRKLSVGRCARVSYLTHDGRRDPEEDVGLHDRLMNANPGHWSPFEHVARAESDPMHRSGNFIGWTQYRKLFEAEHIGASLP